MALSFPFQNDKSKRENFLYIDKKNIIFQFNPNSESPSDLKEATNRRDGFNYKLSLYVSHFIDEYISYEDFFKSSEIAKPIDYLDEIATSLNNESPHAYYIFLQFKDEVNEALINCLFDKTILSEPDLMEFMSEDCRQAILRGCKTHLSQQVLPQKKVVDLSADLEKALQEENPKDLQLDLPDQSYVEKSFDLLCANTHQKQKVLLFSSLKAQIDVLELLRKSNIYLPKIPFLFGDVHSKPGMKSDRDKATKIAENANKKGEDLFRNYKKLS